MIASVGARDTQFSHAGLQRRPLHAEAHGGARRPANYPVGLAQSA